MIFEPEKYKYLKIKCDPVYGWLMYQEINTPENPVEYSYIPLLKMENVGDNLFVAEYENASVSESLLSVYSQVCDERDMRCAWLKHDQDTHTYSVLYIGYYKNPDLLEYYKETNYNKYLLLMAQILGDKEPK